MLNLTLWTALLIPYIVATSCVVIAAGTRFNGKPESAFNNDGEIHANLEKGYTSLVTARAELLWKRINSKVGTHTTGCCTRIPSSEADRQLAAMLVKRDAFNLAESLESLFESKAFSHYIFGIGVLGMLLSTIIILMTINGHAICEVLGKSHSGNTFLERSTLAGSGCTWSIFLNDAAAFGWLYLHQSSALRLYQSLT